MGATSTQEKQSGSADWGALLKWVPVIVLIASMAIAWGTVNAEVCRLQDEYATLRQEFKAYQERTDPVLLEIQLSLTEIRVRVEEVKKATDQINNKLDK